MRPSTGIGRESDDRGQTGLWGSLQSPAPCRHLLPVSHHLVAAPVVHGEDGDAEGDSRPREVSGEGVSEDVEGVRTREVARWLGSPVPLLDDAWFSIGILVQELLVPSHFLKGLKTT